MFKQNKNLLVIAIIAVVNALGYGIIIPILYVYSQKFGMSDLANGMLFAVFSLCQFISTPIIGRLSDKYGRRPLLIVSIAGTALSFVLMAMAQNPLWLFLARALDGITAGNIPVAAAVISDTTDPKNRAKGFGLMGAAFGFGFIFGPVISGTTMHLGATIPFWIAAGVSAIAAILTAVMLPETNDNIGKTRQQKLFDFKKLADSITDKKIGTTLTLTLLSALAFPMFVFSFQPFAIKTLSVGIKEISYIFTIIGIVGLLSQLLIVPKATTWIKEEKILMISLTTLAITMLSFALVNTVPLLITVIAVQAVANSIVGPLIQTMLSRETDENSQGQIMGINMSISSIGTIMGPILGGLLGMMWLRLPFVVGGGIMAVAAVVTRRLPKRL